MFDNHLRDHRHDFFEHLAAFLHEQLVITRAALVNRAFALGTIEKAEIVADIVAKLGVQACAEYFPMRRWGQIFGLDQNRSRHIAKDKMADLNAFTLNSAMSMIAGTARSMGLTVDGKAPWEN